MHNSIYIRYNYNFSLVNIKWYYAGEANVHLYEREGEVLFDENTENVIIQVFRYYRINAAQLREWR